MNHTPQTRQDALIMAAASVVGEIPPEFSKPIAQLLLLSLEEVVKYSVIPKIDCMAHNLTGPADGICSVFVRVYGSIPLERIGLPHGNVIYSVAPPMYMLYRIFPHWPLYSGSHVYPVPHPDQHSPENANVPMSVLAQKMFTQCEGDRMLMWSKHHPYARMRLDLLDFLLECAKLVNAHFNKVTPHEKS